MEKEIRMPYSEYQLLLDQIKTYEEYVNELNKKIEEKDNVLVFEMTSRGCFGKSSSVKILKTPEESFKLDEIFRENVQEKNDTIFNLSSRVRKLERENITLKSKIPWWRK